MKNAIFTISIGDEIKQYSDISIPMQMEYAKRINADFILCDNTKISKTHPHWEKFQIYDLLKIYDRIIYFDVDIIINSNTPNLFDIVPNDRIGMRAENVVPGMDVDRSNALKEYSKKFGLNYNETSDTILTYNSGVIVVSKNYDFIFEHPDEEIKGPCGGEQTYISLQIYKNKANMFSLSGKYNRTSLHNWDNAYERLSKKDSYIVHYAGENKSTIKNQMINDSKEW